MHATPILILNSANSPYSYNLISLENEVSFAPRNCKSLKARVGQAKTKLDRQPDNVVKSRCGSFPDFDRWD